MGNFDILKFFLYWGIPWDFSLEMLEVNLEPGALWLSSDQCSENCWVVKPTRLPSAYQGPWKLAQVFNCGSRSSDNVPVIRASRLPSGDPGTWDLSWRRSSQTSLLLIWRSRPSWVWNIVGSQATCVGLCVKWEAQEPQCPGLAALEFSGLKSQDDMPGSAVSDCIPWRKVLLGSSLGKQFPRGWVIQLSISQSIWGWVDWHIMMMLNFCFFLSAVRGHVPGVLGAVNTLGLMTVAVQSQPGSTGTVHIWAGPPLRAAQWVVFQFLCVSYSCHFAVISRGFEMGLSSLSWKKTLPAVKGWKYERSLFCCCPVGSTWGLWKPVVESCDNENCIMPYLDICNSWQ